MKLFHCISILAALIALPLHAQPTSASISAMPPNLTQIRDEDLERTLLEFITAKLRANPDHAMQVFASLPKGFKVIYATWLVESEVMNGGFHQYFWNPSSEFAEITAPALQAIGDPVAADIMIQALKTANAELPVMATYMKQGTLLAFSESAKRSALKVYDAPFSVRAMGFSALRVRYAREHPDIFAFN